MRLTNRLLDAIVTMTSQVEAGGIDEVQGVTGKEQEDLYNAMMDAGQWAADLLRKRREKKQANAPIPS